MSNHSMAEPGRVGGMAFEDELDLRPFLALLKRRRRLLVTTTALVLAAAVLSAVASPHIYEAEALIQLSGDSPPAYASAPAAARVIASPAFLKAVAKRARVPRAPEELVRSIWVGALGPPDVIRVRVRYPGAEEARDVARAVAEQFVERASARVRERQDVIAERLREVERQLVKAERLAALSRSALPGEGAGAAGDELRHLLALNAAVLSEQLRDGLLDMRTGLRAEASTLATATIVEVPATPTRPLGPRWAVRVLLGASFGLVMGIILALFAEAFTGRVWPPDRPSTSATVEPVGFEPPPS
ncbi:MAG: hypothetical protein A2V88_07710 [Elusimicrobia bacterium RBG_16_66_12]|nr:MAG: hypothetical protein A2V88_07710 [Elusimicrobia bacterium RBG_16_66_12]